MKKKTIIFSIIILAIIIGSIITIIMINNKQDSLNEVVDNSRNSSQYNEKCTEDAKKIMMNFNDVVNTELNIPINIKYDTSLKNNDNTYSVRFIVGEKSDTTSNYFTVVINYNENNNYKSIELLSVAEPEGSISKKTQDQMLVVWKCFMTCKVINISENDRNVILKTFFTDENKKLTDGGNLEYEKVLNGHSYKMKTFLGDYDETLKNYKIEMINYSIDYLY